VIGGEGGAGKTSLACQLMNWAMAEDLESRLAEDGHLILPILIETDFNPVSNDKDPIVEAVRGQLTDLCDDDDPPGEELVKRLLRKQRLLVVIDGLSERDDYTRRAIRPDSAEFAANCMIVTSRLEEALEEVHKTVMKPVRIAGNQLSIFMDGYLRAINKRAVFDDEEYFDVCRRLSIIVRERDVTPLLAKMYAQFMISDKESGREDSLPETISDLMLCYLNELNRQVKSAKMDNLVLHEIAKLAAWTCLRKDFRPTPTPRRVILAGLGGNDKSETGLKYLENRLQVIQSLGAGDVVRFTLDPLAEFLAAIYIVEVCGHDDELWRGFLHQANGLAQEMGTATIAGFLSAVEDCIVTRADATNVPAVVRDQVGMLARGEQTLIATVGSAVHSV